jgi:ATP-dependent RNA helicase RhlE
LAIQIQKSIGDLGAYLKIKDAAVYGGVGQRPQEKAMQGGVDFLVATPGRLLDLMQQGHIELGLVEVLVLDEADRMLDMGFINDIRKLSGISPRDDRPCFSRPPCRPRSRHSPRSGFKNR